MMGEAIAAFKAFGVFVLVFGAASIGCNLIACYLARRKKGRKP
jgi:hypothetical protein